MQTTMIINRLQTCAKR